MSSPLSIANNKVLNHIRLSVPWRQKVGLITIVNVASFFAFWELIARYSGVPSLFLPRFSSVIADIPQMHLEGILIPNLWFSFKNFAIGLMIGVMLALPLAYAVGGIKILDRILSPYIWALYSTPRIILMPLIFLWVGISNNARLTIVIISVIPSMAVVVMEGVKTTDATLIRAARIFGANRMKLFFYVVLPSTIPFIGTGLRMGMLRGLIGLYIGEILLTSKGIGTIILLAKSRFDMDRIFSTLLIFVAFSVLCLMATRYVEGKLSAWNPSVELGGRWGRNSSSGLQ